VPPLRERREAIPAFIAHFIEHYNRLFGKNVKLVSRAAVEAICAHPWAGNVRELGHAIESALLMTENDQITLDDLPMTVNDGSSPTLPEPVEEILDGETPFAIEESDGGAEKSGPYSLDAVIREASKVALVRALQATQGNCHRAAELLGVSRYTVYRMLNRFGLAEGRSYRSFRKPIAARHAPAPARM